MTRVLIIDDDLEMRDQIAATLLGAYYETHTAIDGRDGVNKALHTPPDLIVCDMMMPNMNGQEVLTELRAHPETAAVPFIFLTAVDERSRVRESMNLGADDYLFKPFLPNDLLTAVSTRLKQRQRVMESAEQQLEGLKLRLARMITHELRTPLSLIVSTLGVLSMDGVNLSPDEMGDMIGTMTNGASRLSHCIEQMVFVTYLTTNTFTPQAVAEHGLPVSTTELIGGAIKMANQFTVRPASNVSVKWAETSDDLLVRCEPGALKQALAEIISNAMTFSPADGTVRILCKQDGNDARITVTDSGPGIPEGQLKEALSWFGQVNREFYEQQGMGLGLPLANQLVALHGGTMEIRSVVNKGTRVIVTLPTSG
jgi:two-component system sensor histidine kinase/response regulator